MENLFDTYYTKLRDSDRPVQVLLEYYEKLFNTKAGRSDIANFMRFIKIYGRMRTFYTLTKIATRYTVIRKTDGLERLMSAIISSDAVEGKDKNSFYDSENLTEQLDDLKESIIKNKQSRDAIVFPPMSFDDELET